MRLPESVERELLEHWPVARLVTLRPDGSPAPVPVVFARAGGALWSPVDAKPKSGRELARLRNVRRDPRVALLLDRYAADWALLWWLRVEGAAEVRRAAEPEAEPALAAAVRALRGKYPQYAETALFRGTPTLLRIAPTRVTSWCASEAAAHRAAEGAAG